MPNSQAYDLVNDNWRVSSGKARRNRLLSFGMAVFFAAALFLSLLAALRDSSSGPAATVWAWTAVALVVVFLWALLVFALQTIFVVGPPPTQLRLDAEGIELVYGSSKVRFRVRWSDPKFSIVLRDFRGWQNPATLGIVLDTGDHDLRRIILPSTRPPSALLTSEAYDAILSASRNRDFQVVSSVDTGWRASPGWMLPDRTTRIIRKSI
jgi:hypothetical protein